MTRLLRAELLKLRTRRTAKVFVGVAVGLVALNVALTLAVGEEAGVVVSEEEELRAVLSAGSNLSIYMLILAIVAAAGEYRHELSSSTFLVAPDRRRAVLAQALAYAALGAGLALVTAAVTAAVALPILAGDGGLALSGGKIAAFLLGGVLASGLWGALGVGVGALVGHQAGALIGALVYLLVIESILGALVEEARKYGLSGATNALTGAPPLESAPVAVGGLLLALYTAVFLSLGVARTVARDVT